MNVFSGNSYKPAWLLLLPAFNYFKQLLGGWRARGGDAGGERACVCVGGQGRVLRTEVAWRCNVCYNTHQGVGGTEGY
jgi:hypothetical protein